ncbi:hypothetical protein P7K49_003275 [Saguinus oedipus]|uniref:Uncharacterized protein n=1 Tax=Saguinus oedipus TaxID=9490 RepID=A0ABQ9WJQ6_SAGOE|nr:hypothetical protein P7K49_003275 [Saguinus oedipus]
MAPAGFTAPHSLRQCRAGRETVPGAEAPSSGIPVIMDTVKVGPGLQEIQEKIKKQEQQEARVKGFSYRQWCRGVGAEDTQEAPGLGGHQAQAASGGKGLSDHLCPGGLQQRQVAGASQTISALVVSSSVRWQRKYLRSTLSQGLQPLTAPRSGVLVPGSAALTPLPSQRKGHPHDLPATTLAWTTQLQGPPPPPRCHPEPHPQWTSGHPPGPKAVSEAPVLTPRWLVWAVVHREEEQTDEEA